MQGHEEQHIEFLLDIWLEGIEFNPVRPEGLSFSIAGTPELNLSLRPTQPGQDPFGGQQGLTCKITGSFSALEIQKEFVAALNRRRFTPYTGMPFKLPYIKEGIEQIDTDGGLREGFSLPFDAYPPVLKKLCDDAERVLFANAERFIKMLIWRLQIIAPPNFIAHQHVYWQVDNAGFYAVGFKKSAFQIQVPVGITWDERDKAELQALWDEGFEEPLAHELLREAKTLAQSSPRSALLILAAALETGIKTYIMRKAPQTAGLVDKVPSPPVSQLFKDYLPKLHASVGCLVPYWTELSSLFTSCKKLFEDRNRLAHGSESLEPDKLAAYIDAATELLYLLDVLEGHDWAKEYVGTGIKQLGWPAPRHPRMWVEVISYDL